MLLFLANVCQILLDVAHILPEFCVRSRKKNKLKNKQDTENEKKMKSIYVKIHKKISQRMLFCRNSHRIGWYQNYSKLNSIIYFD